ncbi:MAG TPA: ferredoxin family protein [Solirubrobacteraceae bacterium]|jgi:NAD-dependent dihydropyrimidine dehydrogenase PreA subunit|nr:ferredoxin family protein [Solirubrobacteraceae bacterium]
MIELVSEDRCIKCDVCIRVCPTNVFEHGTDRLPVIKRQADCQTCFMCEAWCPTDALFVSPETGPVAQDSPYRDEAWLIERGLLGSYRRELGWSEQQPLAGARRSTQHLMNREPLPIGGAIMGGPE